MPRHLFRRDTPGSEWVDTGDASEILDLSGYETPEEKEQDVVRTLAQGYECEYEFRDVPL